MADSSATLPNRRYVWAVSAPQARKRAGEALVKEGLVPSRSLLPTLEVNRTGLTRPGRYDVDGNAIEGYKDTHAVPEKRYAVDVRV